MRCIRIAVPVCRVWEQCGHAVPVVLFTTKSAGGACCALVTPPAVPPVCCWAGAAAPAVCPGVGALTSEMVGLGRSGCVLVQCMRMLVPVRTTWLHIGQWLSTSL